MNVNSTARRVVKKSLVKLGLMDAKPLESAVAPLEENISGTDYWTGHNVTNHHIFKTAEESLEYFDWRNRQYYNYIELMPVSGQKDKVVLDYGCGPGHDLVGFLEFSRPKKIYGVDVSSSSLAEAKDRVSLHQRESEVELCRIGAGEPLPMADNSVDFIHSSGVLHHVEDLSLALSELRRVLRPGGRMQIMVYNYNSLWLHLYVAYELQILQGKFPGLSIREAFRKSTDGETCPVSHCYTPEDFCHILTKAGFSNAEFKGAGIAAFEMMQLPLRFPALIQQKLGREHREFLSNLTFDPRGLPLHNGVVA